MAGAPPVSPSPPPPPPSPPILDQVSENMDLLARRDVVAATEAVRVIGLLLARPNEQDRIGRSQRAAVCAKAAADATSAAARALNTESSALEAQSAKNLAEHAEQLIALF
ncbi:hypothetical protein TCAL_13317 [Tigriopus californicus]|uniref:Uncharacterized protein n=1 Tax=Tigriopus californicus TaxID=6832 RepID=A0A553P5Z8_TIGCA|nr:hypothetical protein TCAL_13317 [Tigriopus californicus]|eukprot:TCALIF_13317-PA protein Name:"Protein of unknown function" AED:0.00 eAED:0.00 QI:174/1/1/1/0/0.5/2/186/109